MMSFCADCLHFNLLLMLFTLKTQHRWQLCQIIGFVVGNLAMYQFLALAYCCKKHKQKLIIKTLITVQTKINLF